jgi:hypothetical protein
MGKVKKTRKWNHREQVLAKLRCEEVDIRTASDEEIINALKNTVASKANIRVALKEKRRRLGR